MPVAIISDIHSLIEKLESLLEDKKRIWMSIEDHEVRIRTLEGQ